TMCGVWLGGYLCTAFPNRNKARYALIPTISFLCSVPFLAAAVRTDSWITSMLLFMIPNMLTVAYLAPSMAILQGAVSATERNVSTSLYSFFGETIGGAGGPLLVGVLSDLAPAFAKGAHQLEWALLS